MVTISRVRNDKFNCSLLFTCAAMAKGRERNEVGLSKLSEHEQKSQFEFWTKCNPFFFKLALYFTPGIKTIKDPLIFMDVRLRYFQFKNVLHVQTR